VSLVSTAANVSLHLRDERRLTVLTSRARCALILYGRLASFESSAEWQRILSVFRSESRWDIPACYWLHVRNTRKVDARGDDKWFEARSLQDLQDFVSLCEFEKAQREKDAAAAAAATTQLAADTKMVVAEPETPESKELSDSLDALCSNLDALQLNQQQQQSR